MGDCANTIVSTQFRFPIDVDIDDMNSVVIVSGQAIQFWLKLAAFGAPTGTEPYDDWFGIGDLLNKLHVVRHGNFLVWHIQSKEGSANYNHSEIKLGIGLIIVHIDVPGASLGFLEVPYIAMFKRGGGRVGICGDSCFHRS